MKTSEHKSVVVYTTCPPIIAQQFPTPKPGALPVHMTIVWVGRFAESSDTYERVVHALESVEIPDIDLTLGALDYFPAGAGRIAHVKVLGVGLRAWQSRIKQAIVNEGIVVQDDLGEFRPHVTLGWLPGRASWRGAVPQGSWVNEGIEVSHGLRRDRVLGKVNTRAGGLP